MIAIKDRGWLYLITACAGLGAAITASIIWLQQPLYTLGALSLICFAAWIAHRPLHGVFLTIIVVGFMPQAPQKIGFLELSFLVILGTTLAAWLCKGLLKQRLAAPASPITGALLVLFAVFLLSLPIALARGTTLYEWARGLAPFVPMLVFFVVAEEARNTRTYRQLFASFLGVACWLAGQTVFTYWQERLWEPVLIPDHGLIYRRITWILPSATSPLILGGALIALVEALFALSWIKRLFFFGVALFLGSAIVLTLSRSEIAVFIVTATGVFWLSLLRGRLSLMRSVRYVGLIVLLIAIFAMATPVSPLWNLIQMRGQALVHTALSFLSEPTSPEVGDVNILARLDELRAAFSAFGEQPLLGQGLGYSYEIPGSDQQPIRVQYVHNIIAYFLMTTGLVGTSVFVILVLSALLIFWHKQRQRASFDRDRVLLASGGALVALWLYGLFFAVFRTLGFNLLVGVALAFLATGKLNSHFHTDCDLLPKSWSRGDPSLRCLGRKERGDEETVQRGTDHPDPAGSGD